MDRELLELAQQATTEEWDAFRIMATMIDYQKEKDALIAETNGASSIAEKIRLQ
jgi:hypothetical protein